MSGLFEAAMLSGGLVALVTWVAVVFLAPSAARATVSHRPRAARARLWLYAPLWVPGVILMASLLSGLVGIAFGFDDHCLLRDGHHHHLCLLHPPHAANDPRAWFIVLAIVLPALSVIAVSATRSVDDWRLSKALIRSSRASRLGQNVRLLDRDEPIALTVAVFRPTILLSTGLVAAVSKQTLRIIIAHERAHIARSDTAWALLDRLVASPLPSAARRGLVRDLSLAREQACDAAAGRQEGDVQVAAALAVVARLGLGRPAIGLSITTSSLEARVRHLLGPPHLPRLWPLAPLSCVVAIAIAGAGPIHSLIERIVALLLH